MELLGLITSMRLDAIQGKLYCGGIAGVMGFKRDFHEASIELGSRLIDKIKEMSPEILVTDCLSCRLQFNQLLPHKVLHPVEILREAYRAGAQGARHRAHG
jgi:glycerol-3-phosphate dehydrogenase subunit C